MAEEVLAAGKTGGGGSGYVGDAGMVAGMVNHGVGVSWRIGASLRSRCDTHNGAGKTVRETSIDLTMGTNSPKSPKLHNLFSN